MSKSMFQTPVANMRLQRNAFDLSRRNLFTASAGQLLPCLTLECNPNEHFEIEPSMFLRTQTLNTAAFARMKQNVEFFFVPYRLLMSRFRQFLAGTNFPTSSLISGDSLTQLPYFNLHSNYAGTDGLGCTNSVANATGLLEAMYFNTTIKARKDCHGYPFVNNAIKLLDMLDYGAFTPPVTHSSLSVAVTPFRLCAYQKIFQDFYRLPLYQDVDTSYNLDDVVGNTSAGINMISQAQADETRLDRVLSLCKLQYRAWKKDYITNNRPTFAGARYMSVRPAGISLLDADGSAVGVTSDFQSQALNSAGNTEFTISNIRAAYALDKLIDLTQRAKDGSYESQIAAHFGYHVQTDSSKCRYLGGADSVITIGEVVSTADTSSAPLAKIAGKGVSNVNGKIVFDTPEHGIIMGIYSVIIAVR